MISHNFNLRGGNLPILHSSLQSSCKLRILHSSNHLANFQSSTFGYENFSKLPILHSSNPLAISEHLSKQEQAQASPETTREYRPSDFRWDISISIGDFGIELSENFNRWPGPTLLCLHSLVHGLSESKGFSFISCREKKWIGKESESENRAIPTEFARNSRVFFFSN